MADGGVKSATSTEVPTGKPTDLTIDTSNNGTSKGRSQVPPDSPLLRPSTPQSPTARRARELQREARKAKNFRASLDRSSGSRSRGGTPCPATNEAPKNSSAVMTFSIKPSVGGRKGWKIMPESGEPDQELLQRVVDMIRDMEFSGKDVPERITLKV